MKSTPKTGKKWRWRIISLVIAGFIIVYMLSLLDGEAFGQYVSQLSPQTMLAAFAVYVLLNFFRAIRFRVLLGGDVHIPLIEMFPVALAHNFLVRLLPFKLGELAYFVLLRDKPGFTIERGISSLFGARFLELLVIVVVALCSLFFSGDTLSQSPLLLAVLLIVIFICSAGLYFAANIIRIVVPVLSPAIPRLSFLEKLVQGLNKLADSFQTLQHPRRFGLALFWSLFTYSCSFGVNWILLRGIGIDIDFATLVIIISLGMFATAVPFNLSGFGVVELSWAFSLSTWLAYSAGEATSIGLMLNGFQLLAAAISGMAGYIFLRLYRLNTSKSVTMI